MTERENESNTKIERSCGTHDGSFHADEVTACALLVLFNRVDKDKIVRTRDPKVLNRCQYVCDVGGIYNPQLKLFDHHQQDYQGPLSSAGMILLYLFEEGVLSAKERAFFDNSLITGVDAHDNGRELHSKGVCTYSHIISNFNSVVYDVKPEAQDKAFFEAVDFALSHLTRMWERYQHIQSCRQAVAEAMQRGGDCLIFDRAMPWLEIFFEMDGIHHPARFVIMPSGQHWKLRGIPPSLEEKMKVRLPLPLEWAGLSEAELQNITHIAGAIFCHKGRFISVWETKEDALKALEILQKKK